MRYFPSIETHRRTRSGKRRKRDGTAGNHQERERSQHTRRQAEGELPLADLRETNGGRQ
jgi:hypothetical protein